MFPQSPSDFIGPTAVAARLRCHQAAKLAGTRAGNFRLLLTGPQGTGKSSLARLLARQLTGVPDNGTPKLTSAQLLGLLYTANGQDVSVDLVREWTGRCAFVPCAVDGQPGRRVFWVDECDAASPAALNHWRTFSDSLPPGNDLLLTTNQPLDKLQAQFTSRCQVSVCGAVDEVELARWLSDTHGVAAHVARDIAATVKGDVRAALNEAAEWHDLQALAA